MGGTGTEVVTVPSPSVFKGKARMGLYMEATPPAAHYAALMMPYGAIKVAVDRMRRGTRRNPTNSDES